MQLKIQRSQRVGGVLGNTVLFCLDVRAAYSDQETTNINKYKLGKEVVYNSSAAKRHIANVNANVGRMGNDDLKSKALGLAGGAASLVLAKLSLNISIASLGRGHHIECKDMEELLEAEDTVRAACKNVTRYLDVATTFDGSQVLIEYDKGEEKVHVSQNSLPLIEYRPDDPAESSPSAPDMLEAPIQDHTPLGTSIHNHWLTIEGKLLAYAHSQGWNATVPQVRLACIGAAIVVFFILMQI